MVDDTCEVLHYVPYHFPFAFSLDTLTVGWVQPRILGLLCFLNNPVSHDSADLTIKCGQAEILDLNSSTNLSKSQTFHLHFQRLSRLVYPFIHWKNIYCLCTMCCYQIDCRNPILKNGQQLLLTSTLGEGSENHGSRVYVYHRMFN